MYINAKRPKWGVLFVGMWGRKKKFFNKFIWIPHPIFNNILQIFVVIVKHFVNISLNFVVKVYTVVVKR